MYSLIDGCYHECKHCASRNNSIKGQEKSKQTCLKHFGVEYSFQSENNKRKSVETKLKKYGKNWKKIQANYMIDYWKNNKCIHHNGDDPIVRAKMVENWKKTVAKKSVEELRAWRSKIIGMSQSQISKEFFQKLQEVINLNIIYEHTIKDNVRSYSLDGYIENVCIIEFFGDYWHANPDIYQEDTLIKYHSKVKLVKEVWLEDQKRLEGIQNILHLPIIIVWENDYKSNNDGIINLIKEKINRKEFINGTIYCIKL